MSTQKKSPKALAAVALSSLISFGSTSSTVDCFFDRSGLLEGSKWGQLGI